MKIIKIREKIDCLIYDGGYLKLLKSGKSNFYLNEPLFDLFLGAYHGEPSTGEVPLIESM